MHVSLPWYQSYLALSKVADEVFPMAPNPTPTAKPSADKKHRQLILVIVYDLSFDFFLLRKRKEQCVDNKKISDQIDMGGNRYHEGMQNKTPTEGLECDLLHIVCEGFGLFFQTEHCDLLSATVRRELHSEECTVFSYLVLPPIVRFLLMKPATKVSSP